MLLIAIFNESSIQIMILRAMSFYVNILLWGPE